MDSISTKHHPSGKLAHFLRLDRLSPRVRRVVIGIIGGIILLVGIALIPLPGGPSTLVIPAGLVVLATEFTWAERWLQKVRGLFRKKK